MVRATVAAAYVMSSLPGSLFAISVTHEFPGAVVGLVLAAVFSLIAYRATRSKSK